MVGLRSFFYGGKEYTIPYESALVLAKLVQNMGKAVPPEAFNGGRTLVSVRMKALRSTLKDVTPYTILTVYGEGYQLVKEGDIVDRTS